MMTKTGQVVCCLHTVTSGLQGAHLGTDESPIVLLEYALIDLATNQVLAVEEYVVRPPDEQKNPRILSSEVLEETNLSDHVVRLSSLTLEKAISQFQTYLNTQAYSHVQLVTDGQFPIRQVIHPEAWRSSIELPYVYNSFCDLRKDVARFYGSDTQFDALSDMLIYLDIPHSGETDFYAYEFRDMINIVQRLITDGYKFTNVEIVNLILEPGICSRDEEIDNDCVVRARGLPWQSSDKDIAQFFRGLNVAKGGVALCLSPMGRRNGEALVRFTCTEHREMALKRHRHHIGQRYIEVYRASGEEFVYVAGGTNNDAQAFLTKGANVIIRMRGLPYECTAKQVMEFFLEGESSCNVMDGESGVLFVKKPDGRSTGDAFVLFEEETDANKALSKHRQSIGTRYIELFRSTTAEVQQVLNRAMESSEKPPVLKIDLESNRMVPKVLPAIAHIPHQFHQAKVATTLAQPSLSVLPPVLPPATPQPALPPIPQFLPQHIITSGTRKDCIRLRGLPYEAQVEHILDFLGEHSKSILFQGVHMVYNSQGQPSGEAFIQMESEAAAALAAQSRHHCNMTFGKKQRYIEVFQCSGEDMSLVLSGGLPGTPTQLSPVPKITPGSELVVPPPVILSPSTLLLPPAPPPLFLLPKVLPQPLKRTWNQAFQNQPLPQYSPLSAPPPFQSPILTPQPFQGQTIQLPLTLPPPALVPTSMPPPGIPTLPPKRPIPAAPTPVTSAAFFTI